MRPLPAVRTVRRGVTEALDAGASLRDVERSIADSGLEREQRDALWLLAWERLERAAQSPGAGSGSRMPLLRA